MDVSEFHPSEIPAKPGVYVFRDRFGEVIYVGKARQLRRRLSATDAEVVEIGGNNTEKKRILQGDEPFLFRKRGA